MKFVHKAAEELIAALHEHYTLVHAAMVRPTLKDLEVHHAIA
jgi:hypothetical protein